MTRTGPVDDISCVVRVFKTVCLLEKITRRIRKHVFITMADNLCSVGVICMDKRVGEMIGLSR